MDTSSGTSAPAPESKGIHGRQPVELLCGFYFKSKVIFKLLTANELGKMLGIGIDIIEAGRARLLYQTYRKKLGKYLSEEELSYIHSSRVKALSFAEILAIKEAVFKALELPWFGLQGWKKIALSVLSPHRFSVRLLGSLKGRDSRNQKIWISVASTKDFVLARALIEKVSRKS